MKERLVSQQKVLFIVPDGVGMRNYLYSNLITELTNKDASIVIWSTLPKEAFDEVEIRHGIEISYKQIKIPVAGSVCRFFKEISTYARLLHNSRIADNKTILKNWRKPKQKNKRWYLYKLATALGSIISKDYKKVLRCEAISDAYWSKKLINHFKNELINLQPNSILITHQRVHGLMPICLAAKELEIKTHSAIYSWDNMPKARLAVKADKYFVWSDYMKQEMAKYYPEIPQEAVMETGTPQFEFYNDASWLVSRRQFADTYGLDVTKKWICFSGDDVLTSPFDPQYLEDIGDALEKITTIQIIFRRCPVDFSKRYNYVLEKYKNIIIPIDPEWTHEEAGWTGYYPMLKDIGIQVNLAKHCETVINLGSTMAHDFTMFNKPCLYLNYNPVPDENWNVNTIYNYQHFRSMEGLDAVGWLNSKADIAEVVLKAINAPELIAPDRKLWMQRVVLQPVNESSKLIAKLL